MSKKVVYIAGPITGVENYRETFAQAEEDLESFGYIPLNPANLPQGMTNDQYMRITLAMLDSADAVLFLLGWEDSEGAKVEHECAKYIKKPIVYQRGRVFADTDPVEERRAWMTLDLMEVFGD
jgi:nucleoside 2-deoxyribosyltransferase